MKIRTISGPLEVRGINFSVLQVPSVNVIIGCEVLGYLKFEVSTKYAYLKGLKIPRIMTQAESETPVGCVTMKVAESMVVETKENGYYTILCAVPSQDHIACLDQGDYEINLLTDCFSDVAYIEPIESNNISRPHIRISRKGELKAVPQTFAFRGYPAAIPDEISAELRKALGVGERRRTIMLIIEDSQKIKTKLKKC